MKATKRVWVSAMLATGLLLMGLAEAYRQAHLQADVSSLSPSGEYRLENVPVNGPFFLLGGKAYLRIVSTQRPHEVYRSPLYNLESVDMTKFEDDQELGIVWVTWRKHAKDFEIALPDWRENWQNIFISNTPYTVYPN